MDLRATLAGGTLLCLLLAPGSAPGECNGGAPPPVDPPPVAGEVPEDSRKPEDTPPPEEKDPPPPEDEDGTPTPPEEDGGTPTPPETGGGTPTVPGNGGGTPSPGGGGGSPSAPGGGRPGTRTPRGGGSGNMSTWGLESWEDWWLVYRDRYLDLRRRSREGDGRVATEAPGDGTSSPAGLPVGGLRAARAEADARRFLLEAFRDPRWAIRGSAAISLGRSGTVSALPGLLRLHGEKVRDVRGSAAVGAGLLGEPLVVPELSRVLFDPTEIEHLRGITAVALGILGGPEAARALLDFIDPAADARRAGGIGKTRLLEETAVAALGMTRHAPAAEALRKHLASGNRGDRSRAFAAVSLARLGDRESLPLLLQALRADHDVLRQAGAVALGVLCTASDAEPLAALVRAAREDRDATTRRFALLSLGRFRTAETRAPLLDLLARGKPADRPYAALALGISGAREAGPVLLASFRECADPEARGAFALALGLVGHRDAAPELLAVATSRTTADLRGHCFSALGLLGHRPAAAAARAVLEEPLPEEELVPSAAACLALLGERGALGSLPRILGREKDHELRAAGYRVLGLVGDSRMLPELVAQARDRTRGDDQRTRALEAIGALLDPHDPSALSAVPLDSQFLMFEGPLRAVMGHR